MLKCKNSFTSSLILHLFRHIIESEEKEGDLVMKFDELFEQRSIVASKLKDCIRDLGYTKVSFASKADISRPTLDKLLNGEIDNKSSFDRHLQKY